MRHVTPQVFLLARPAINPDGLAAYLRAVGVPDWTSDAPSDAEALIEIAGRSCYRSFEPGLNPNVTKVRDGNLSDHQLTSVSIHAPARGATFRLFPPTPSDIVSIHAPARGATLLWVALLPPRKVSIHAPARGRPLAASYPDHPTCFNPRPRAGGDTSALPRRVRPTRFNPRPRAGGDPSCVL